VKHSETWHCSRDTAAAAAAAAEMATGVAE